MTEHAITRKTYYQVFAVLMALLVATIGVSYIHLGPFNIVAALAIAVIKALLVILYFMHAKTGDRLVWVFIAAATVWLIILIAGTAQDVLTRGWF